MTPYATVEDLPLALRHHLPPHAQAIYRGAFNRAWQRYGAYPDREGIAHRIAWAAVKRSYRKLGEDWVAVGNGSGS